MSAPPLTLGFELVHIVTGYRDGVVSGVANFHGHPHHFERAPKKAADRDRYLLTPLTDAAFAAAIGGWEIWCRWEKFRQEGKMPNAEVRPDPAVVGDSARQDELDTILGDALAAANSQAFYARGDFRALVEDAWGGLVRGGAQVRWTVEGAGGP